MCSGHFFFGQGKNNNYLQASGIFDHLCQCIYYVPTVLNWPASQTSKIIGRSISDKIIMIIVSALQKNVYLIARARKPSWDFPFKPSPPHYPSNPNCPHGPLILCANDSIFILALLKAQIYTIILFQTCTQLFNIHKPLVYVLLDITYPNTLLAVCQCTNQYMQY